MKMTDLICKARRKDNGELVEGFYFCLYHNDGRTHLHHFIIPLEADLSKGTPIDQIQVEVVPESITLKTQEPGPMTLEQVAAYHGLTPEGVDYALRQYQIIISEITHGMLSKLSYDGHDVLKCAQERWCDTCELKEAQKPISSAYAQLLTQEIPRCGKCGYRLVKGNDKYCCKCGQAVKWDG